MLRELALGEKGQTADAAEDGDTIGPCEIDVSESTPPPGRSEGPGPRSRRTCPALNAKRTPVGRREVWVGREGEHESGGTKRAVQGVQNTRNSCYPNGGGDIRAI